jgi:hypothetical protein
MSIIPRIPREVKMPFETHHLIVPETILLRKDYIYPHSISITSMIFFYVLDQIENRVIVGFNETRCMCTTEDIHIWFIVLTKSYKH